MADNPPDTPPEASGQDPGRRLLSSLGLIPVILIPLGSVLAAAILGITGLYYQELGVKPDHLGINLAMIVTSTLVAVLDAIGSVGPFLFITPFWRWVVERFSARTNPVSRWLGRPPEPGATKPRKRIRYLRRVLWWLTAIVLVFLLIALSSISSAIIPLVIAPVVIGVVFLSVYGDEFNLPWRVPPLPVKWYLVGFGIYLMVVIVSAIVIITNAGPDLRVDGAHGGIELNLLDVDAQPVIVHQVGGPENMSRQMLRLGRAEGTWVLYDPCDETAFYFSINSVYLEVIDEIDCGME